MAGQKVSTAVDLVMDQIKAMIESNNIKPGDKLPAERVLAQKLGVSRNSVREALLSFEALGIVETIIGSGSYLVEHSNTLSRVFSTKQLIEKYNLFELVEAREVLEIGIVELAAKCANREDKIRLREIHQHMEKLGKTTSRAMDKETADADYRFHFEIARIAGNSILIDMLEAIHDMLLAEIDVVAKRDDTKYRAIEAHGRILEAIVHNDVQGAKHEMAAHLRTIGSVIDELYQSPEIE